MGIIIKKDNKYVGSFEDFQRYLTDRLKVVCETREKFGVVDFAECSLPDYNLTVTIGEQSNIVDGAYNNVCGWFGIQELKSPFNNASSERQFISDFYSGGYFDCANIYTGDMDNEDIKKAVKTLVRNKNINSNATVVWEVIEEEKQ
ncbi:MAG: hypothetical protein J6S85_23920 [Methanobrevibacter sp.]|nr:hypothetical protein [Methanobrevibacter sp.]